MLDQSELISEDNENDQAETTKKGKAKIGTTIAAGLGLGFVAVGYDAAASSQTGETPAVPGTSSDSSDAVTTDDKISKDSAQTAVPDSVQIAPQPVSDSASIVTPIQDITLIPDHLNVGNAPDNMSFEEAFNLCRENLGSAAVFEWQGHLYHTCTPAEYAVLPEVTKNAFENLWLENEMFEPEWVPVEEGTMGIVELLPSDYPEGTYPVDQTPADTTFTTTDSTHTPSDSTVAPADSSFADALNEWISDGDSTVVESPGQGIVYSTDDFDNNFDGKDEWVNPEDIIS